MPDQICQHADQDLIDDAHAMLLARHPLHHQLREERTAVHLCGQAHDQHLHPELKGPARAQTVKSVAGQSDRGPPVPNGVIETTINRGLIDASAS